MQKFMCLLMAFNFSNFSYCQMTIDQNNIRFEPKLMKVAKNKYEVHIFSIIDKGFHLYANQQPKGSIATPTTFSFSKNPFIKMEQKLKEIGHKLSLVEPLSGYPAAFYLENVEFIKYFTLIAKTKTQLKGKINYQLCNDTTCFAIKDYLFEIAFDGTL